MASPLLTAQPRFTGPVSGHVFDAPTKSIRPVLGLPGAAWLGAPLAAGLDRAFLSPDGARALAFSEGRVLTVALEDGAATEIDPAAVLPSASMAAWTNDSTAVVLWSPQTRQLQRIELGGGDPVVGAAIALDAPGELTALAIGADYFLVGLRDEAAGGVYQTVAGQPAVRVLPLSDPASIVISADGRSAYVADRASAGIVALKGLPLHPRSERLLEAEHGVDDPIGLALTRNGLLLVASRTGRSVRAFRLSTRELVSEVSSDTEPETLQMLPGGRAFLLAARHEEQDPLLILDDRLAGVFFVPAGQEVLQ